MTAIMLAILLQASPEEAFVALKKAAAGKDYGAIYDATAPAERKQAEEEWERLKKNGEELESVARSLKFPAADLKNLPGRNGLVKMLALQDEIAPHMLARFRDGMIVEKRVDGDAYVLKVEWGGKEERIRFERQCAKWHAVRIASFLLPLMDAADVFRAFVRQHRLSELDGTAFEQAVDRLAGTAIRWPFRIVGSASADGLSLGVRLIDPAVEAGRQRDGLIHVVCWPTRDVWSDGYDWVLVEGTIAGALLDGGVRAIRLEKCDIVGPEPLSENDRRFRRMARAEFDRRKQLGAEEALKVRRDMRLRGGGATKDEPPSVRWQDCYYLDERSSRYWVRTVT